MPQSHRISILALGCALVAAAFVASPGLFTIDELIYLIGAAAMASGGSLTVDNGFSTYGADALRLWFLSEGPNGLAPQYPVGSALFGAPLVSLLGPRGFILLNAVAGAAVLWLTWRLGVVLYRDERVGIIAVVVLVATTFFADFALGIWPHMVSAAFVLGAFLATVIAATTENRREAYTQGLLAGFLAGLGILFRADTVLLLPVIGAGLLFHARRPIETGLMVGFGLIPSAIVAMLANQHKFGTLNPLSYGSKGGGTDLTAYFFLVAIIAVGLAALTGARLVQWRQSWRWVGLAGLAIFGVLAMVLPPVAQWWDGFYALFVDMRTAQETRPGVFVAPSGATMFFGLPKKALGQSLPWIAVIATLVVTRWRSEDRHAHLAIMVFCFLWSLPFVLREWHGGFGWSARYFLPMVPLLACLSAALIVDWMRQGGNLRQTLCVGIPVGLALYLVLQSAPGVGLTEVPQLYGAYLMGVLATGFVVLSLPYGPLPMRASGNLGLVAVGFGFAIFSGAVADLTGTQRIRSVAAASSAMAAQIEGPVLFYSRSELFPFHISRDDVMLALPGRLDMKPDAGLISAALADGYRVFATEPVFDYVSQIAPGSHAAERKLVLPGDTFLEVLSVGQGWRTAVNR